MRPLISVLLPTRNRSRLLGRALGSIQRQSLREIEILVLDDGSCDETPRLLEHAAREDSRVRWVRREHSRGLADALNTLIAMSCGQWLARMDDDDVCHPRRLELQLEWMESRKVDICGTWYRRCSSLGKSSARPPVEDVFIRTEMLFQPPLLHPSVVMRRQVIERHGAYSVKYPHAEDYELWVRLSPHVRFGNVPHVLMDYTLAARQVSRRYNRAQVDTAKRIREAYLKILGIRHNERELKIHCDLRDPVPIETLDDLDLIEQWLMNLKTQLPTEAALIINRQWFLTAVRAAGLGPCVYQRVIASPLCEKLAPSKKAILKAICAARLQYRSPVYRWLEPLASVS